MNIEIKKLKLKEKLFAFGSLKLSRQWRDNFLISVSVANKFPNFN